MKKPGMDSSVGPEVWLGQWLIAALKSWNNRAAVKHGLLNAPVMALLGSHRLMVFLWSMEVSRLQMATRSSLGYVEF